MHHMLCLVNEERLLSPEIKKNLLISYKPFVHLATAELTKPNVVSSV